MQDECSMEETLNAVRNTLTEASERHLLARG